MNIKYVIYNGILTFVIYSQELKFKENIKKFLLAFNYILIIFSFLAAAISIIMFFFNWGFVLEYGGNQFRQGFYENRLFGVYTSPNVGALTVVCSIAFSFINSLLTKKSFFKWNIFYIINAVFQLLYFSLTSSRGGQITWLFFVLVFGCFIVFPILKSKFKMVISILLTGLIITASGGISLAVTEGLRLSAQFVANAIHAEEEVSPKKGTSKSNSKAQKKKISLERSDTESDYSTGRFPIWISFLEAYRSEPLYGLGDVSAYKATEFEEIDKNSTLSYWFTRAEGNAHNVFIHILAYSGAFGLIIFLIFLLIIAKRALALIFRRLPIGEHSRLLCIMLCVIALLLANSLVEAHLLYNKQDPFAIIFWCYLGIIMSLLPLCNKEVTSPRIAFVADTPYQVLNSVNCALNNIENCAGKSDIFIWHQFTHSREISARLKELGIFENVYDVEVFETKSGLPQKLDTLKRAIFPLSAINKAMNNGKITRKKQYTHLFCAFFTPLTFCLHRAFPMMTVNLFEDGLGSYFGNFEKAYSSRLYKILSKILGGAFDYSPKKLYVYNKEVCKSTVAEAVYELPGIESAPEIFDKINFVFDFKSGSGIGDAKILYLSQPYCEIANLNPENVRLFEDSLINSKYIDSIIKRNHPREKNYTPGFKQDELNNLWELEISHRLRDDQILLAYFSTAQFSPKFLCGKEPYLIFCYKLLSENTKTPVIMDYDSTVANLRSIYRNSHRIFVPESLDEFSGILEKIGNGEIK